ncbi:uncharacterized protein LOC130647688 isoform X1 [Hydractinia symbiolongicarpus]|uniref:uncharacterized protein LOC130647688 isoform X1 n=1 Tax=Hydractinia symbiolongicarpus TaxID=13093 RepID=UPI0025509A70|nr:uncharacterized protein LOC130647688 isoform X1 [Hydractinia symbiolongicarpus]
MSVHMDIEKKGKDTRGCKEERGSSSTTLSLEKEDNEKNNETSGKIKRSESSERERGKYIIYKRSNLYFCTEELIELVMYFFTGSKFTWKEFRTYCKTQPGPENNRSFKARMKNGGRERDGFVWVPKKKKITHNYYNPQILNPPALPQVKNNIFYGFQTLNL